MDNQPPVVTPSFADTLHQIRISAFISAYDGAADQADRFQLAEEYRDIFILSNDQPSACARLISSGAITLLTGLIIGDAAHRIADPIHLLAVQSLLTATDSIASGFQVHQHATLAADLARAAEVLVDRTDTRKTITDETLAGIGFCLNAILSLFARKDDQELWFNSWERLKRVDAAQALSIALATMLCGVDMNSAAVRTIKGLIRFLGPLAKQTSMLLAFGVWAVRRSGNNRSIFIDAARGLSAEWTRDYVVLRVSDLLRVASDADDVAAKDDAIEVDTASVFTAVACMLDVLVLDEGMHDPMLRKNFIVDRLLYGFWQVVKLRGGHERQAMFNHLISIVTRMLPEVKDPDIRVVVGAHLLGQNYLSVLGGAMVTKRNAPIVGERLGHDDLIFGEPSTRMTITLTDRMRGGSGSDRESFRKLFALAVKKQPDLLDKLQPEWYHIWNQMQRSNGKGRIMDDDGLEVWRSLGESLNITPENCKADVVQFRYAVKGGCNWHKCPLHLARNFKALAVEMMRCNGCQMVGYCSNVCQKRDWRDGGHAQKCKLAS